MADETGDTKNLGLGVTFVATITKFTEQLEAIRTTLGQFKTDLEAMGKTGKEASEKLTSANKETEKAITQATAATKAAVAATGEAAKATESLGVVTDKASKILSSASKVAAQSGTDFKGLSMAQMSMVNSVKSLVSEPVLGSLVDKLKKAAGETEAYQRGLVGAAKQSGSSMISFNQLSSALLTNEKHLSGVSDGAKKLTAELGVGAVQKNILETVEKLDRLKFANATVAGEMYKTNGVVFDGRTKFAELQKTIAGMNDTLGQAAMNYVDGANRLGSYGTTVKSITEEAKKYNAVHAEALGINDNISKSIAKMNAVYGGADGLSSSTGKYRAEFDKLVSSLDGSKNKMVEVENDVKRLNGQFVTARDGSAAFTKAVAELGAQSPKTAAFVADLSNKVNAGNITHKDAVQQVKAHGSELTKLSAAANTTSGFWTNLTGKLVGGGAAAHAATDYFSRLGQAVGSLAAWIPAALIIGGLTEAITGAVAAVKDYDQALKSLQAISGGTEAEISLLGKEMLHVSDVTKYSAAEIAKGAIFIAQAGFTAGESLQVIAAAAKGAQGTLEPLTTAANLLTTVLRAFHIDASESSRVMDMLAMAANKSKTDLEGMKVVFNYLGPAAYAAGVSLNETLGTLMALSNVGMRMSTVGTSLRQVFIGLENPSGRLKRALEDLGMTTDDLSVKKMGSLEKVLINLDKVIGGSLTNAVQFFNVRAGNAALVISQMNSHVAMMIKYTEEYGASAAMAGTQTEGMAVKMSMLSNQFQNFIIRMTQGGLTDAFKGILNAASGLISVIEYLVNNPLANFIITTGVMAASLGVLYSLVVKLGGVIAAMLIGTMTESAVVAMKTVGVFNVFGAAITTIIIPAVTAFFTSIGALYARFQALSLILTPLHTALAILGELWAVLSKAFLASPIGWLVAGLSLLAATIYTVTTSSEKHSKALQENTITYANNASAAERYAETLRKMNEDLKKGTFNSDSYNAALRQIKDTFPELTKEMVLANKDLLAQASALDKVAIKYRELNEAAAKAAVADLARQFRLASNEAQAYSSALMENKNQFMRVMEVVPNLTDMIKYGLTYAITRNEEAARLAAKAWIDIKLAWNTTSASTGVEAAEKLSVAMNKQRDLFPQVASIIINSSKDIRESLLKMIPEGEMRDMAIATVTIHERMVASLKVGASELVKKELDSVGTMGRAWVEYYEKQNELGRAEVANYATLAKAKVDAHMKQFKKGTDDAALIMTEQLRFEQEMFTKMLDARGKHVEDSLKLMDKLYEQGHARRKTAFEIELQQLDLRQKSEITALENQFLKEDQFLLKKEEIEKAYFERNMAAIAANTEKELAALNAVFQAKKTMLDFDTSLTEEAKKSKMVVIETENALKMVAIYKEELAALKTHISEKMQEHTRYKTEYDKAVKEIQSLNEAHLKVMTAAHKKYVADMLEADKAYRKQLADLDLDTSKKFEDLAKMRRDALQLTMSDSQKMADKQKEINDTLVKGYAALVESERATDSETKKAKVKAAQDYFKEAQGMISGIESYSIASDGAIIKDLAKTQELRIGFIDKIEAAITTASETMAKAFATQQQEAAAAAAKLQEDTVKTSEERKNVLIADLQKIAEAAKANMEEAQIQITKMLGEYTKFVELLSEAIAVKADSTQVYEELTKLVNHIKTATGRGDYDIVLKFMGEASPREALGDVISKIKGWITDLYQACQKTASFVVNFSGFGQIDSLISSMNALFAASNRTAIFTIVTKEVKEGSTGGFVSGDGGVQQYAKGGDVSGTDTVPAMLTPGEFVVRKSAVQTFGEGFFQMLNGTVSKFAKGGPVKFFASGGLTDYSRYSMPASGSGGYLINNNSGVDYSKYSMAASASAEAITAGGKAVATAYKTAKEEIEAGTALIKAAAGSISNALVEAASSFERNAINAAAHYATLISQMTGYASGLSTAGVAALPGGGIQAGIQAMRRSYNTWDRGFASGGSVPGTGNSDTVPAMLTPGEFVVRKSAVSAFGEGFFHMVNRMKSFSMPKFNMGGIVQAFANGGPVRSNEVFTLNLQAGAASLPLKVMGNPANMRQQIHQLEKELSRMRLSHA